MINWLTKDIATGAFNEVSQTQLNDDVNVLDVRDLVDKSGNDLSFINSKVDEALMQLKNGKKIIICCDYGMSRSNSIAIGAITKWNQVSFEEATDIAKKIVPASGIKIEVLNTVYDALYQNNVKQKNVSANKNVLLTGGSGFIGKRLKSEMKNDFNVFAPDSKSIDLSDDNIGLYQLVKSEGINTIVHLANPKIFTTNRSVGDTMVMLKNILDVCRTSDIKFVYLSGWEVYSGYKSDGLLANEILPLNPKGTYGETKWLCELLIKQYHFNYGLKYQIIRSGPVYGTGGEKPKFIYNFINKALKNEEISTHRFKNGFPILDLLHIDDLVKTIKKIVLKDIEGDLNIGSGKGISTFEIATIICELTQSSSKIKHAEIQDFASNIIMDISRSQQLLNWAPEIDIRTGLNQIIQTIKK